MTVALIASLLIMAGMLGLVVWSVQGRVKSTEHASASDIARVTSDANLAHAQFELEHVRQALSAANARADVLEEILNDEIQKNPNSDLAAGDWKRRVLRVAARWAVTDKSRVLTRPGAVVPEGAKETPTSESEVPTKPERLPKSG